MEQENTVTNKLKVSKKKVSWFLCDGFPDNVQLSNGFLYSTFHTGEAKTAKVFPTFV